VQATSRYPNLFSPIRLGPLELRHRAVMSGHGMNFSRHVVSSRQHAYFVARARGGAALLTVNSTPVHPSAFHYRERQLRLYDDDILPGLRSLAGAVHAEGSKLSIILWHGGHHVVFRSGHPAWAPSPVPSVTNGEVPKEMTRADIRSVVAGYGAAAARCRAAGLDAVEVQTASDYLLGSFLSPTLNRRTDEYGGSLENRARIVVEVLEAVREAAGDGLAVGVRTSAAHLFPLDPDGLDLDTSLPAMQLLAGRGLVDWVSVMLGSHANGQEMIPLATAAPPRVLEVSARFREALDVPVMVAGRIRTPADAEAVLAEGRADVVAMARSWIADPDWAAKAERGEEERIRTCITCNQGCWGHVGRGTTGSCVLNPEAGREEELGPLGRTELPQRVAVVGGGPAGLEAARLLALRGHEVVLHEASNRLGGQLRLAGEAPGRGEVLRALEWWEGELRQLGVDVRLAAPVATCDKLSLAGAETVVWAVGARPGPTQVWRHRPQLLGGIPGTEGLPHGREVLAGERDVAGRVLVVDEESGWPAVSLAEALAARLDVDSVTLVTTAAAPGDPDLLFTNELRPALERLAALDVEVHPGAFVAAVADGRAQLVGGGELGPFDAIVLSTGTLAEPLPDGTLAVGDCVTPRGWWAATHDAALLARAL
jgi:2,4-dienoyl-CoA reductase (NADPH2)